MRLLLDHSPTEINAYAFTVKGEFPDVAHRDGTFGFTEYA